MGKPISMSKMLAFAHPARSGGLIVLTILPYFALRMEFGSCLGIDGIKSDILTICRGTGATPIYPLLLASLRSKAQIWTTGQYTSISVI